MWHLHPCVGPHNLASTLIVIVDLDNLVRLTICLFLGNLLMVHLLLLLHEVIWPILLLLLRWCLSRLDPSRCHRTRLQQVIGIRYRHILRYHVAIVLIHRVVTIAIRIHINLIQLVIYLRLKELLDLQTSILGRQLLRQPQQQLILVPMRPLLQLLERILQVLHRVVPQLEQELDHVIGVLLCVHSFFLYFYTRLLVGVDIDLIGTRFLVSLWKCSFVLDLCLCNKFGGQ